MVMDLLATVYAAVEHVRAGGVNEIEVRHDVENEVLIVTVRRWTAEQARAAIEAAEADGEADQ
jgi:hypothetical protein